MLWDQQNNDIRGAKVRGVGSWRDWVAQGPGALPRHGHPSVLFGGPEQSQGLDAELDVLMW